MKHVCLPMPACPCQHTAKGGYDPEPFVAKVFKMSRTWNFFIGGDVLVFYASEKKKILCLVRKGPKKLSLLRSWLSWSWSCALKCNSIVGWLGHNGIFKHVINWIVITIGLVVFSVFSLAITWNVASKDASGKLLNMFKEFYSALVYS